MEANLSAIPKLHPALRPFIRKVLVRFEEVEVEADDENSNVVVFLLPIAGTKVRCLFDLQSIDRMDVGLIGRPKLSNFIVTNYFESIVNSWDPGNVDCLAVAIDLIKKATLEFYESKLPTSLSSLISRAIPSDVVDAVFSDENSDQTSLGIRLLPDRSILELMTGGAGPDWDRISRFFIDCFVIIRDPIRLNVPNRMEWRPSPELNRVLASYPSKSYFVDFGKLLFYLKNDLKPLLNNATVKQICLEKHRRTFMAALVAVFGEQVINIDRAKFDHASILFGPSSDQTFLLLDIKIDDPQELNDDEQNLRMISSENSEIVHLKFPAGISLKKTPLQAALLLKNFISN